MPAKIREARRAAGLSQQELADKAGVSQALVARMETGELKDIRVQFALALAKALGRTVEELFDDNSA